MDYLKEIALEQDLIAKIREQKDKIVQQQKELGESLEYASSIQSALLPDLRLFYKIFPFFCKEFIFSSLAPLLQQPIR